MSSIRLPGSCIRFPSRIRANTWSTTEGGFVLSCLGFVCYLALIPASFGRGEFLRLLSQERGVLSVSRKISDLRFPYFHFIAALMNIVTRHDILHVIEASDIRHSWSLERLLVVLENDR